MVPIVVEAIIGVGVLLIVAGLWPFPLPGSLRIIMPRLGPIVRRLLFIICGFLCIGFGIAIQSLITNSVGQFNQLVKDLIDRVGPTGTVIGGAVVIVVVLILLVMNRRARHMNIPIGVQRWPPPYRASRKTLTDLYVQAATLTVHDALEEDRFGQSLAVSGNTLVGMSLSNSAYVFTQRDVASSTWDQPKKFVPTQTSTKVINPRVAMSGDRILIGLQGNLATTRLAAVFVRTGSIWQEQAQLSASNETSLKSLAISGDTIAVGTYDKAPKVSAVYCFVWDGFNWNLQARLETEGNIVSLYNDTLCVGADKADGGKGRVDVFVRQGTIWQKQAQLRPKDKARGSGFGNALAMNADTIVCGAPNHFRTIGAAYVFVRDGLKWKQQARLLPADRLLGTFGYAVAIDGDTIAIGAPLKAQAQGFVHVYTRKADKWLENLPLTPTNRSPQNHFGTSLAISGDTIVAGMRQTLAYKLRGQNGAIVASIQANASLDVDKLSGLVSDANNQAASGFVTVFRLREA